jgi:cephalosporin hydroxylase
MNFHLRGYINRVLNFIRPKPRFMPLSVNSILESQGGLDLVEKFNDLFYSSGVVGNLTWRGIPMMKNPCDLWMMLELFQLLNPRVILETGTHHGGSATFFADMMALFELPCKVITIDINPKWSFDPASKGIVSLVGYSTNPAIVKRASQEISSALTQMPGNIIVTLDSDHSKSNVLSELRLYSPFVTIGSYLIVEDTNVNGHPSLPSHGPGPWEAVEEFVKEVKDFEIDRNCERFLVTSNPNGWLRRIQSSQSII